MAIEFLTKSGLELYDKNIKNYINEQDGVNQAENIGFDNTLSGLESTNVQNAIDEVRKYTNYYAVCETASDINAKVVECEGFELKENASIMIKFTNAFSINSAYLNINNTGNKRIYTNISNVYASGNKLLSERYYLFVYGGEYYKVFLSEVTARHTTIPSYIPIALPNNINSFSGAPTTTNDALGDMYYTNKVYVQPSTGKLYATEFVGSVAELNEKVLNVNELVVQKTDIFSCDYVNSSATPAIEYTECYLNRENGTLNFDITITFDTAEQFINRSLTILDGDCYYDLDNYDSSIHSCLMYLLDISETASQGGIDNNKCDKDTLGFNGNGSSTTSARIVACLPVISGVVTRSIKDDLNECINKVELSTNGVRVTNVLGEESTPIPLAGREQLGIVKSTATYSSAFKYHKPCPIIDGVPYFEKHIYAGMLTLNGDNSVGSYTSDTSNDTITLSIPCGNDNFYRNVFNIYIYHMNNIATTSPPCGYSHITLFPNILAYPSGTFIKYIIKTASTSGGAVLTDDNYSVSGHGADQQYLDFTITGISGWQSNLYYRIVVD